MTDTALRLQVAGADLIAICTNTMHKLAPSIEKCVDIPIIHIADATGESIRGLGLKKVTLLGTNFTTTGDNK